MTTATAQGGARGARAGARLLAWGSLLALALYYVHDAALPYLLDVSEATYGRFWPRQGWLLVHVLCGTTALLIGPFQFWSAFREKYRPIHRWSGRVYVGTIVIGSATAFYLSVFTRTRPFAHALFVMALFWLATTVLAYVAIRNGRTKSHREWMIRSYVLTFTFVTFRWWVELARRFELGDIRELVPSIGWTSWVLPLFATEVILRWRETTTPARRAAAPEPTVRAADDAARV